MQNLALIFVLPARNVLRWLDIAINLRHCKNVWDGVANPVPREEVHEFFANFTLVLVVVHVAAGPLKAIYTVRIWQERWCMGLKRNNPFVCSR